MTKNIAIQIVISFVIITTTIIINADTSTQKKQWKEFSSSYVAPIDNYQYKKSCGNCHEAYPAGLLPPQSWESIIFNSNNHFDKDLQLEPSETREILNYLLNNAAGRSQYILSHKIIVSLQDSQPIRITQIPFFISKHQKLSGNLGQCSNCHTQAINGSFNIKELK